MESHAVCLNQLRLDFHPQRPVDVSFQGPQLSSDGGLVLIRALDDKLQLSQRISRLIPDHRNPLLTIHSRWEQTRQRLFQIVQGYHDCNDAHALRHDPAFKITSDLLPEDHPLSSQPTLCRFENAVDPLVLWQLQSLMMDLFVSDLSSATTSLTLDLDGTMLETHGHQQLALFHGYYETTGYYPLTIWDAEGRLACVLLRPGSVHDSDQAFDLLERLVVRIRRRFPWIRLLIRGDAMFSMPEIMDGLETLTSTQSPIDFVFGIKSNDVLIRQTKALRDKMRGWTSLAWRMPRRYLALQYKAKSWSHARRVIARLETQPDGSVETRYVVTSSQWPSPAKTYKRYCRRGQAENYIKDYKLATQAERMSCGRFEVNGFRALMHGFAYWLLYKTREKLATQDKTIGMLTLRSLRVRILKVACVIKQSLRRIHVEYPASWPHGAAYRGALAGQNE